MRAFIIRHLDFTLIVAALAGISFLVMTGMTAMGVPFFPAIPFAIIMATALAYQLGTIGVPATAGIKYRLIEPGDAVLCIDRSFGSRAAGSVVGKVAVASKGASLITVKLKDGSSEKFELLSGHHLVMQDSNGALAVADAKTVRAIIPGRKEQSA